MSNIGLLKILQICDSLFPVGSFTLSNGLETYVQKNIITCAQHLQEYLDSYLCVLPYNELGAAALAYKGFDLCLLDEIYNACKASMEIRNGSRRVAGRFFRVSENTAVISPRVDEYRKLAASGKCVGHHPLSFKLT